MSDEEPEKDFEEFDNDEELRELVERALKQNIVDKKKPLLMDYIDPKKITYLPNTAGCFNSKEALGYLCKLY